MHKVSSSSYKYRCFVLLVKKQQWYIYIYIEFLVGFVVKQYWWLREEKTWIIEYFGWKLPKFAHHLTTMTLQERLLKLLLQSNQITITGLCSSEKIELLLPACLVDRSLINSKGDCVLLLSNTSNISSMIQYISGRRNVLYTARTIEERCHFWLYNGWIVFCWNNRVYKQY